MLSHCRVRDTWSSRPYFSTTLCFNEPLTECSSWEKTTQYDISYSGWEMMNRIRYYLLQSGNDKQNLIFRETKNTWHWKCALHKCHLLFLCITYVNFHPKSPKCVSGIINKPVRLILWGIQCIEQCPTYQAMAYWVTTLYSLSNIVGRSIINMTPVTNLIQLFTCIYYVWIWIHIVYLG